MVGTLYLLSFRYSLYICMYPIIFFVSYINIHWWKHWVQNKTFTHVSLKIVWYTGRFFVSGRDNFAPLIVAIIFTSSALFTGSQPDPVANYYGVHVDTSLSGLDTCDSMIQDSVDTYQWARMRKAANMSITVWLILYIYIYIYIYH